MAHDESMADVCARRGGHLARVEQWAASRSLKVRTWGGNQRDPEHGVTVTTSGAGDSSVTALLTRTSLDSADVAAMYLINALELLGAWDEVDA